MERKRGFALHSSFKNTGQNPFPETLGVSGKKSFWLLRLVPRLHHLDLNHQDSEVLRTAEAFRTKAIGA